MVEAYMGEIKLFAGKQAPSGWSFCDGTVLSAVQYPALYALLQNKWGGTPNVTFALPDLRTRVPVGLGQGPGLSARQIGDKGGAAAVSVSLAEYPVHNHSVRATLKEADTTLVSATAGFAKTPTVSTGTVVRYADSAGSTAPALVALDAGSVGPAIPISPISAYEHENHMPYITINYIICIAGLFPPQ